MLVSFVILCVTLYFSEIRSQRNWSSLNTPYNSGFSNSWNFKKGFSISNNKPSAINNNAKPWGSDFSSFMGRSEEKPIVGSFQSSNWEYETALSSPKTFDAILNKPVKSNSKNFDNWQSDVFNTQPNQNALKSIANVPNFSKWNINSNNFQSNSMTGDWDFNSNNNKKRNGSLSEYDYEDNSIYSSWNSDNKKNSKPVTISDGFSKWEITTSKNYMNAGTTKWNINKSKKPSNSFQFNSWNSSNTSQPERGITSGNSDEQKKKKSSILGTSILDELDKNDWYFGKESNYPKPPFQSTLNIDVSELWNSYKNKKSNQNNRGSGTDNYNRRRNRQIEDPEEERHSIECECVNVIFCEEKDMIVTRKDVKFDSRSLKEFRCKDFTEVCCTNPKKTIINEVNFKKEKKRLRCGQRRIIENPVNPFKGLGENIAEQGEFPWNLKLENEKINCSASLIHQKLALTAAHCVTGIRPEEFVLKAGIWNSNNEPSQSRQIAQILIHPDYNSQNPRNDIALLILETPFELTDNVNTICLPVTNDKWDPNQCIVAGWRLQEIQGQIMEVLEKGVVNFLPQTECQNIILITDLWRNYVLHDSFVCSLQKTESKSCTGDEGGFVICPSKKQPNTYLQIGIVSKGINCDNFGRPGIFTNVLKFLDWINRNYFELQLFDNIDIRGLQ